MRSSLLIVLVISGAVGAGVLASAPVSALCEASGGNTCYYVSPSGSDSNPGTEAQPFYKPMKAVKMARAGDYIYLRGGTYTGAQNYAVSGSCPSTVTKRFIDLERINVPACVSETGAADVWNPASGTASALITIKAYPGETPYINKVGQIRIGDLLLEVAYWRIQGLRIEGSEIFITGGYKQGQQTYLAAHDIWITDNELFNRTAAGGSNVGLIKINRGDYGGPYNIFIHRNVMHDLQDSAQPGPWNTTTDWQHFGSVAVESCATYLGANCGSNGYIEIVNNTIYNVPALFFFKNPMEGPVVIRGNTLYNAKNFGRWGSANMLIERNVFYRAGGGADLGQFGGGEADWPIALQSGQNITIQYNTFVSGGFGALSINGSGHTSRFNVFTSSMGNAQGASGNTAALYTRAYGDGANSWYWPDSGGANVAQSQLMVGNNFNDNCIVTGQANPLIVKRYYPTVAYSIPSGSIPSSSFGVQFFNLSQAQQTFGFETRSVFIVEPTKANIFVDFANDDYHLKTTGPIAACANMGAYAPGGQPPPVPVCGNGVKEGTEQCDLGGANGACPSTCSISCTTNSCGPVPKPGDRDGDGDVDASDILLIAVDLNKTSGFNPANDLNTDGKVDLFDLVIAARNWG